MLSLFNTRYQSYRKSANFGAFGQKYAYALTQDIPSGGEIAINELDDGATTWVIEGGELSFLTEEIENSENRI